MVSSILEVFLCLSLSTGGLVTTMPITWGQILDPYQRHKTVTGHTRVWLKPTEQGVIIRIYPGAASQHWNIVTKCSSLTAPEIVKMTTSGVSCDENFVIISFPCVKSTQCMGDLSILFTKRSAVCYWNRVTFGHYSCDHCYALLGLQDNGQP